MLYTRPKTSTATRTFLAIVLLIALYAWRKPWDNGAAAHDTVEEYVPHKIYEADPGKKSQYEEDPNAPSFPVFKSSSDGLTSQPYNPYPDYNSRRWKKKWKGVYAACQGPRGDHNKADTVRAFEEDPFNAYPAPMFGSYSETGLDNTYCFDQYSRYRPYGHKSEEDRKENLAKGKKAIDWKEVDWGRLQSECVARNFNRYEPAQAPDQAAFWEPTAEDIKSVDGTLHFPLEDSKSGMWSSTSYQKRSAVVMHLEASIEWTIDMTEYLRSLIMELSLHSGAEYEIIILIEAPTTNKPIFSDPIAYSAALKTSVPPEFRSIALLYTRALLEKWYPKVPKSTTSNFHQLRTQALQLLSLLRPSIEHIWHLSPPARYTGHHYHHLSTLSTYSAFQSRHLLWERSARYYIPTVYGNNYAAFVSSFTPNSSFNEIWGPVRIKGLEPVGPDPPFPTPDQDAESAWGVGEEADLITLGPIFPGPNTSLINYPNPDTPSRLLTSLAVTRYSKRLLRAMHHGQITLGTASSPNANAYAASTALHHGLKVVAVPVPGFLDLAMGAVEVEKKYSYIEGTEGTEMLGKIENILGARMSLGIDVEGGESGEQGKGKGLGDEVYKRWVGYGNDPGEKLCLPGMLLYPVRGV